MDYQSVARLGAQLWRVAAGAAAGAALAVATPGQALAVAHGKLTIDAPTGTAGVTDAIDVFLTLTLDPDSAPIVRAGPAPGGGALFTSGGVTADELTWAGFDASQPFIQTISSSFFGCGGPSIFNCGPEGPYSVQIFSPLGLPGPASLPIDTPLSFKFATLTPRDPLGAPPGTYSQRFGLGFSVVGKDLDGNTLRRFFEIASVCDECAFTRQVGLTSPTPEPQSWALMIAGLGAAGAFLRRQRLPA
jgi:hypothetical protein